MGRRVDVFCPAASPRGYHSYLESRPADFRTGVHFNPVHHRLPQPAEIVPFDM